MAFASVAGQKLFFEDSGGSGPAVLLSHGFLMDHTMFAPQLAVLAPAFRVICWDERGFGQTQWDGRPFTYWDSAADALGLLDHLGIERAVLGGMSQGGFLSLRAALKAPERVAGLVLFDTQAGVDDPEVIAGYHQMLSTWTTLGPIDPLIESLAGIILGSREHWEPWVTQWRRMPKESVREPSLCLLEREDITARMNEIAAPAIVFHGTADHAIPMSRGEALAAGLAGCRGLVKVEGGAHAANLTHPAQVNPALVAFLKGL
jgi:3-oxoadipate enol-lactonase